MYRRLGYGAPWVISCSRAKGARSRPEQKKLCKHIQPLTLPCLILTKVYDFYMSSVLIESLATRSPSPNSPTSSISSIASASAGPTHHQVNTAQLLHALLTAPSHAMPLNQLKTAIGGTRALYACVAKKLIRIDRGGGEQVVLFDA